MIVRLTPQQHAACLDVATKKMYDWLDRGKKVSARRIDVTMPPIGWRQLANALMGRAFTVHGQRAGTSKVSPSCGTALRKITKGLNELEAHPAFRGLSVPGVLTTAVLGWPLDEDRWSPYPTGSEAPVLFEPHRKRVQGLTVTYWQTAIPGEWLPPVLRPESSYLFTR